jgi:ABC-type amino acid transport substrate-binding protein
MAAQLKARQFDLIMGGVAVTTPRLEKLAYSAPYMQATLAFIVPDHRRSEFASSQAVKSISDLKIGIPHMADYFFDKVKNYLPQAEVIEVKSAREFFEANEQQIDALLWVPKMVPPGLYFTPNFRWSHRFRMWRRYP